MAEPKTTLWPLEPHTKAKHEVLKRYIDAWLPVLGSWNGRILFIDGFAGPGEYAGGEPGSPIIALNALRNHTAKHVITAEVGFVFIEREKYRVAHLAKVCEGLKSSLPPKCWIEVVHSAFESEMEELFKELDEQNKRIAPTFVMVDPFGVSGLPMNVLGRILQNERCELYVSFMYESINRFKTSPEFEPHLDELFGCKEWRDTLNISDAEARKRTMYDLYRSQLKKAGAQEVVHFDLYDGNRLIYAIFFASASKKGCDMMKQSIWKVAPFGSYAFHGSHTPQLALGLDSVDFGPLQDFIVSRFGDQGWVSVEEISRCVASDECDYHTGQLKKTLKNMEKEGKLEVQPSTRIRRFTYPDGTQIRIKEK